jgi:L-lactate utilization protein LutB
MEQNLKKLIDIRINKTVKALEKNNMKGFYAENREELYKIIAEIIKDDNTMSSGGSVTLEETGVTDFLNKNYSGKYFESQGTTDEEYEKFLRKVYGFDTYFMSSNAITENGELYNVDGRSNRISALVFGPKKIIVVAGYNKIVTDLGEAVVRVKNVSAPANAIRLNRKTPCTVTGQCSGKQNTGCQSDERICCNYLVSAYQRISGRINVIFLPEVLGY